ncbi:hypothetical protein G6F42_019098 [Rhizopus arrhizus]|nr:hypothetical protein G6F42_019098 [Rhizopus arrhizus]
MGGTLPEFYARRATLNDLKYAQQITDVFNEAFGSKNSNVAGNMMHILLFQRDEQGNDKAAVGTLTVEKDGLLDRLAVDVGFLSRRLGKILIGFILEEMKKSGYSDYILHVFENRTDLMDCLQGIVIGQAQKEKFMQRLVGLCGNDSMVDLFEHELVFIPSTQTPVGPARNDDVVLRLQSKIHNEKEYSMKYRQW